MANTSADPLADLLDGAPAGMGEAKYQQALITLEEMARVGSASKQKHYLPFPAPAQDVNAAAPESAPDSSAAIAQLRYRALVEQIPAVTFMAALDASVHELYISPQIESLLGFSQQEWLEDPFLWYWQLHPDDRAKWGTEFARTCSTGVNFRSDYRLIARSGKIVWVHGECQLVTDENGKPLFLMGIAFDITDQKVAEEKVQEANRALNVAQDALTEMNQTLERRVAQRTVELETAHQQLVKVARQAGMAEIATEVLHNVGNVLNSVNVRAGIVREKVRASRLGAFERVCDTLDKHADDLGNYLSRDTQGQLLPDYIKKLTKHLMAERTSLIEDIDELNVHVEHMNTLISAQQSYAGGQALIEPTDVADIIQEATNVCHTAMKRNEVSVRCKIPTMPKLMLDRHRVMQILMNLITNAAQACGESSRTDRSVTVRVDPSENGIFRIVVTDNGIGIASENLARIFSHGFTTREDGHGFGLHSAANAAKEMGGSLTAASNGLGQGATFTLILPAKPHVAKISA